MSPEFKALKAAALAEAKRAGSIDGVLARMEAARALIEAGLQLLAEGGMERTIVLLMLGKCVGEYRCPCKICRANAREGNKGGCN